MHEFSNWLFLNSFFPYTYFTTFLGFFVDGVISYSRLSSFWIVNLTYFTVKNCLTNWCTSAYLRAWKIRIKEKLPKAITDALLLESVGKVKIFISKLSSIKELAYETNDKITIFTSLSALRRSQYVSDVLSKLVKK